MKTTVTVLGNANWVQPTIENSSEIGKYVPIVFTSTLNTNSNFVKPSRKPEDWQNIELITKDYIKGVDLMFAFNEDRDDIKNNALYLGRFNDGFINTNKQP